VEYILTFCAYKLLNQTPAKNKKWTAFQSPPSVTAAYPKQPYPSQAIYKNDLNGPEADWCGFSQPYFDGFRRIRSSRVFVDYDRHSSLDEKTLLGQRQTVGFLKKSSRRIRDLCLVNKLFYNFLNAFSIKIMLEMHRDKNDDDDNLVANDDMDDKDLNIHLLEKTVKSALFFQRTTLVLQQDGSFQRRDQVFPPALFLNKTLVKLKILCGGEGDEFQHDPELCVSRKRLLGNIVHKHETKLGFLWLKFRNQFFGDVWPLDELPRQFLLVSGMFFKLHFGSLDIAWKPKYSSKKISKLGGDKGGDGKMQLLVEVYSQLDNKPHPVFKILSDKFLVESRRKKKPE
jgi:hypothetical protein